MTARQAVTITTIIGHLTGLFPFAGAADDDEGDAGVAGADSVAEAGGSGVGDVMLNGEGEVDGPVTAGFAGASTENTVK